ncbi:unnamed protein product [Pieris brassicae]|uniref:DUF3668 domain-containing protein n=1 Tax=Pieris brassicae TaxID=7116 RepID=A0A9P0TFT3_PIEBR|nr:unnamed protein product [Pieris brassicae]
MDELRGPTIQIVLHVKEGLGFGFLRSPFIVSGSLNGYMLETDPTVPAHAPVFDAELVWEADKRRFRSLRVQNVPVKVEVYSTGSQGRKDKIGYLLLSLLGAQPCPSNKLVNVKHSWHKLLGVKSEGKCCHPQLLMSLTIEDRVSTPTPRNELRMFHSNEVAYPSGHTDKSTPCAKSVLLRVEEYIAESKKVASSLDLQPKLVCDEGLIQIGDGNHLFVLSLVIGSVENLDLLLPTTLNETAFYYVTYSVFTHNIMTDRVCATSSGNSSRAHFNQRTSLRLRTTLNSLDRYFAECPHLVTKICLGEKDIGICSMDLRKLVPTDNIEHFLSNFCNNDKALTIHERCFILRCDDLTRNEYRRPYMDVELSLKYQGVRSVQKPILTARSATQLKVNESEKVLVESGDILSLGYRAGSCTDLQEGVGAGYSSMGPCNTGRYTNASGEAMLPTNEIANMIKKMCDSFATSQEILTKKPTTCDMQVQCDVQDNQNRADQEFHKTDFKVEASQSESCISNNNKESSKVKDAVHMFIPAIDRDAMMQKFVNELEDWKEKQQELYKIQLRRKEEYHLELLAKEWAKRRVELETKLSKGIDQCRHLAADLSRATEDFALRGHRNTQREKKLLEAKKALEAHYTAKYQELREASQKMEDDMNHQLKLKDMKIQELQYTVQHLEKIVEGLKINLNNVEKEAESRCSGLTKDQTASLIQELRCLEEKLESAVQSKAFFKEQWGRAVRELHLVKLATRRQMLTQLRHERRQLADVNLDPIIDEEVPEVNRQEDMNRLKDDFYVDILANSPPIESRSVLSISDQDGLEINEDVMKMSRNAANSKLSELISQREQLIQEDEPDETELKHLNHEIRNMLINCAT